MKFSNRTILVSAIAFLALMTTSSFTNPPTKETTKNRIEWLSWEEAIQRNKTQPKKIFIDIYTDWCGWCKRMDATTFKDKDVIDYMNKNFHAVKLDAEQRKNIVFNGHTFKYIPSGRKGYHELAASLLDYKLSFPSFVALDEKVRRITIIPGYKKANDLSNILSYIAEGYYLKTTFKNYVKNNKQKN